MGEQVVATSQPKYDMEVTDERFAYMKNFLLRLYADQNKGEIVSVKVFPVKKDDTA